MRNKMPSPFQIREASPFPAKPKSHGHNLFVTGFRDRRVVVFNWLYSKIVYNITNVLSIYTDFSENNYFYWSKSVFLPFQTGSSLICIL